jgi:hypothetical protein
MFRKAYYENWDDYDFVFEKIQNGNGREFAKASFSLKNDEKLRELAIKNGAWLADTFISNSRYIRISDPALAIEGLKNGGKNQLGYLDYSLMGNKEVVLVAVKMDPLNLLYASDELKDDFDIVFQAIQSDVRSIGIASDRLKSDITIGNYILDKDPKEFLVLINASPEFALQRLSKNLQDLRFFPNIVNDARVQKLLKNKKLILESASIIPDKKSLYEILHGGNHLSFLNHIADDLKNDENFMLKLLEVTPKAYPVLSESLKNDPVFINKAMQISLIDPYLNFNEEKKKELAGQTTILKLTKAPQLDFVFYGRITIPGLTLFKKHLDFSIKYISKSPIKKFKKVFMKGKVFVGQKDDILASDLLPSEVASALQKLKGNLGGFFDPKSKIDDVFIILNGETYKTSDAVNLIHELAHKFQYHYIKNGIQNQRLKDLYDLAKNEIDNQYCELPQIGDPLSNLRDPKTWSISERFASSEYYLKKIDHLNYIYENEQKKQIVFSKGQIRTLSKCPSEYSTKAHFEWFAEMVSLATLNLAKPSEKMIVEEFIKVVNEESI